MTTPYQDLITEIEDALIYAGFNSIAMRKTVVEDFDREEVIKVISVYVMTGNSIVEKVGKKKVADQDTSKTLVQFLKEKKVFGKKKNLDSLTLARFAITFPVLTLKVRMMMKQLKSKLPTSTPVEMQDLCFNSFLSEPMVSSARDFIDKFSFVLSKAKDPAVTVEQSQDKVNSFRLLGEEGHKLDVVGQLAFKVDIAKASIDEIMDIYGFEAAGGAKSPSITSALSMPSLPLPVKIASLPVLKTERILFAKEPTNRDAILKVVEVEDVPKGVTNRKQIVKESEDKAIDAWVSSGV